MRPDILMSFSFGSSAGYFSAHLSSEFRLTAVKRVCVCGASFVVESMTASTTVFGGAIVTSSCMRTIDDRVGRNSRGPRLRAGVSVVRTASILRMRASPSEGIGQRCFRGRRGEHPSSHASRPIACSWLFVDFCRASMRAEQLSEQWLRVRWRAWAPGCPAHHPSAGGAAGADEAGKMTHFTLTLCSHRRGRVDGHSRPRRATQPTPRRAARASARACRPTTCRAAPSVRRPPGCRLERLHGSPSRRFAEQWHGTGTARGRASRSLCARCRRRRSSPTSAAATARWRRRAASARTTPSAATFRRPRADRRVAARVDAQVADVMALPPAGAFDAASVLHHVSSEPRRALLVAETLRVCGPAASRSSTRGRRSSTPAAGPPLPAPGRLRRVAPARRRDRRRRRRPPALLPRLLRGRAARAGGGDAGLPRGRRVLRHGQLVRRGREGG